MLISGILLWGKKCRIFMGFLDKYPDWGDNKSAGGQGPRRN